VGKRSDRALESLLEKGQKSLSHRMYRFLSRMYLQTQEPLIGVCYSVWYLFMLGSCCPIDFGQLQRSVTQRRLWPAGQLLGLTEQQLELLVNHKFVRCAIDQDVEAEADV